MSRVEIEGQFNTDNLCSTCNSAFIEIKPRPILKATTNTNNNSVLTVEQIPNWETFRVNANQVLQEATTLKRKLKCQVIIFYVAIALLLCASELRKTMGTISSIIEMICFYIVIMYLIYVHCLIHKKYNIVMQNVRRVAREQSRNGVRYVLCDEKYGWYVRSRSRRYYILIYMSDEENDIPMVLGTPLPAQEPDIPVSIPVVPVSARRASAQRVEQPAIPATVVGSNNGTTTNSGVVSIFDQLRA